MSNLLEQASLVMIPSGYKEDVVYSEIPLDGSGDLQFTRSSNGTRVNSAGLVEVVPWNLVAQSESIGTSPWLLNGATLTSGQTDPSGGTTAVKVELASGGNNYVYQGIVLPNPINVVSAYLRADSATTIGFSMGGTTPNAVNLTTTWQLFTFSSTDTSGGIIFDNYFGPSPTQQAKTFYIWHPQLNIGSTAKPYFPTTDRLNVPRLTYQNGGGGCPSLLLEKQSTNKVTYSEQFDNANWNKLNLTITANSVTSPDGTQNADTITDNTTNSGHYTYQFGTQTTGTAWSCFMKKGSLDYGFIGAIASSAFRTTAIINLTNGSIVELQNGSSTTGTVTAEDCGNGWYRVKMQTNANGAGYSVGTSNGAALSGGNKEAIYTGTGSGTIYLWGAQLEDSTYATSYIPTTSSSATRVADVCAKTGIGALIGGTSGTVFFDIKTNPVLTTDNYKQFFYYTDSSANQGYMYLNSGNGIITNANFGNLSSSITLSPNTRYKIALTYANNDFALYVNGVSVATASSGTPLNFENLLSLGSYLGSSEWNEFVFNQYTHFPSRLTNAELASLTSL
jgi:hypothetical protein